LTFTFFNFNNIEVVFNILESGMIDHAREETTLPAWLASLEEEDLQFLRRFLLSSGSLKALAEDYRVSYPTVRGRLDRLIAKVQAAEDPRPADAFERRLRVLVADGMLPIGLAKELLTAHKASLKGEKNHG
jgi:hypothetical protein